MVQVRPATRKDIPAVAQIFLTAFHETIRHLFGSRKPQLQAALDLFTFVHEVEPACFLVAADNGSQGVVGYILAPKSMRRLWLTSLTRGYFLRWCFNYVTGRYGLGIRPLKTIASNKLTFLFSRYNFRRGTGAQILSIAVAPVAGGKGIGRQLMERALEYLVNQKVREVKLEVRPWNEPACQLYKKLGFQRVGTTRDSQGEWLVMIKTLLPDKNPPRP